jgi:hypothetical protein
LRHSFTTQIQKALHITSMPDIWLSGFCGYKTTWAPRKCVVYSQYNEPQRVLSPWKHIAHSWQMSINDVEENTTHLFQKSKAANTLNITADGIYNYHSARKNLYNSHSILSWLSCCTPLLRITSFPCQFIIQGKINFLCKHKSHFTHDIGCTIWTGKTHSEWKVVKETTGLKALTAG